MKLKTVYTLIYELGSSMLKIDIQNTQRLVHVMESEPSVEAEVYICFETLLNQNFYLSNVEKKNATYIKLEL